MSSIGKTPIGTEAAHPLRITRTVQRPRPRRRVVARDRLAHAYGLETPPSAPPAPLHLVRPPIPRSKPRAWAPDRAPSNPAASISTAATLPPTDPRWVLALRTAETLQGSLLTPPQRDRLIRLGAVMGLSPFDANLIIAIVQDRARRGHPAAACPAAGIAQLTMIPAPVRRGFLGAFAGPSRWRTAYWIVTLLTAEVLVAWLLLV